MTTAARRRLLRRLRARRRTGLGELRAILRAETRRRMSKGRRRRLEGYSVEDV